MAFSLFCSGVDEEERLVTAVRADMEGSSPTEALQPTRISQNSLRYRP
jgi:hypothetical protein